MKSSIQSIMKTCASKLIAGIFIFLATDSIAQQISPLLVGTNVWYNDPGEQAWNLTMECGMKTIRIGGHAYDKNLPSKETLLDWVQKIQAVGAVPILQVSQYQPAEAVAELVRFLTWRNMRVYRRLNTGTLVTNPGCRPTVRPFQPWGSLSKAISNPLLPP